MASHALRVPVNRKQAIDFIRRHGVVLEAAHGREPSLAEQVAGERIRGAWWGHPRGQAIFELTRQVRASRAILVCSLADGRITYVHRHLWPAFVRLAARLPDRALDKVTEVHRPDGRHQRDNQPFPDWVPPEVLQAAKALSARAAAEQIQTWLLRYGRVRQQEPVAGD